MIRMKRDLLLKPLWAALVIVTGGASVLAQGPATDVPLVVGGKIPLYPIMARAAQIQGVVKIKVVTDGKKVTSADVESGVPMLAQFAKENVLTWEFSKHKPTTFVTTFKYVIEGPNQCAYSNGSSTLNLPLEVRINAKGVETCDPATENKPNR
jgi:hypothetical protein